ncbi:unnamed protein product [Allacma fusca]|uniref:Uncharacterized protein n=1 Tax=Allacma fusca TaxID=39272 RepID=A0A8J2KDD2_9HEXA|nr:unnamed protein product [Allacma fusca]
MGVKSLALDHKGILGLEPCLICTTPVRLAYDEKLKRYTVRKCFLPQQHKHDTHIFKLVCALVQLVTSFSILHRVYLPLTTLLGNKKSLVAYFDFMDESLVNFYIYFYFYSHWFHTEWIEELVVSVQTTKLRRFSTLQCWQAKLFAFALGATTFILSINWIRSVHGISLSSLESFLASGESNAKIIFWNNKDTKMSTITSVMAIIARFYNCLYHQMIMNSFLPSSMLMIYWIGKDFFNGIKQEKLDVSEVLTLYEEYKLVIIKGNNYCSSYLWYYINVILLFHGMHLFDTLNYNEFWWKTSMYIYYVYTWLNLWLPVSLLIHTKELKRFLWKDRNYLTLERRQLVILLHDMIPGLPRKGIKAGEFSVSSGFCATVISTVWSNSMLISLSKFTSRP